MLLSSGKLYHHGIKGQRWGVRRFQNKDGSLTSEGEKRYSKGQEKVNDKKDSKERARRAAKFSRDFAIDVMGKQVGARCSLFRLLSLVTRYTSHNTILTHGLNGNRPLETSIISAIF